MLLGVSFGLQITGRLLLGKEVIGAQGWVIGVLRSLVRIDGG